MSGNTVPPLGDCGSNGVSGPTRRLGRRGGCRDDHDTLNDMTAKKQPDPSAEEIAARELVRVAKEQGLSLTGADGLLEQFTTSVLETALNEEMTEHLGFEKHAPPGAGSGNIRNGTRGKTCPVIGPAQQGS